MYKTMLKPFSYLLILYTFLCNLSSAIPVKSLDIVGPLDAAALKEVVSGNSLIGKTCHTHSLYELYFYPDGKVIFRKANDDNQIYWGKWWISGNTINSQWASYKKKPSINTMQYYKIGTDTYMPFNINDACGPAGTFGSPFIVIKGKVKVLEEASKLVPPSSK